MKYITFQRIITLLVGIGLLYFSKYLYYKSNQIFVFIAFILIFVLGLYIVIASLIPYKKTTKGVSNIVLEGLLQFIMEYLITIPIKIIIHLFTH